MNNSETRYEKLKIDNQNLSLPIEEKVPIPKDSKATETTKDGKGRLPKGDGKRSIFNRYSIFYLNEGPLSQDSDIDSSVMDYRDNPVNWRKSTLDNNGNQDLSTAKIINTSSDGFHNGMD